MCGKILIAVLPLILVACAVPKPGTPEHESIQKTIDTIGGLLGGKPPANGVGQSSVSAGVSDQAGKMVSINAQNIIVEGPHPTDARWKGRLISETPLNRFFDKHPISRPGDYWPRISIRIDDYSESLAVRESPTKYMTQMPGAMNPNVPRPLECIKFTAVIWMSEKQSQKIDNVVLCSSDMKTTDEYLSIGALRNYRNMMAPISISSEQVRTFGPRVPAKLLPDTNQADIQFYSNGQHLFSSMFIQMGYRGPLDGDQRLWFVNLTK